MGNYNSGKNDMEKAEFLSYITVDFSIITNKQHVFKCWNKTELMQSHDYIYEYPPQLTFIDPMEPDAKQKYRGMFESQTSGNKTRSGEIGLNIRTLASPKVGKTRCPKE